MACLSPGKIKQKEKMERARDSILLQEISQVKKTIRFLKGGIQMKKFRVNVPKLLCSISLIFLIIVLILAQIQLIEKGV